MAGEMGWIRITRAVVVAIGVGMAGVAAAQAARLPTVGGADFLGHAASPEAQSVAQWAVDARNAQGKPFAIVDKKAARLFVFAADGRLLGAAPALLGQARGDASAPGVGDRVLSGIPLQERTTPAGRFESEPGRNDKGEAIVWVDYEAAIAIHRLRPMAASQRRPERLASASVDDKRISLGCIVVSPAFYDAVIAPSLGRERGVVYVLPETRELTGVFGQGLATLL